MVSPMVTLGLQYLKVLLFGTLNCRARLLDLAVLFLPGLKVEHVDVLFSAIKPALKVSNLTLFSTGILDIIFFTSEMFR